MAADANERRPELPRRMLGAGGLLAAFAVVGAGLVALTADATRERIAANERAYLLRSLNDVLPATAYDNDMFTDTVELTDPELLGSPDPLTAYRARRDGQTVAATSGGVYERTDAAWQRRLSNNAQCVSFVPGSSSAYYAGLWGDLARTGDGGTTWTINSKISDQWIEDIAIDPADVRTLFIADRSHVRRSTDGGGSFEAVLEGLNQAGESYRMNTLIFDPADHNHIYAGGGNFSAPRVLGDLWESRDGGDTWRRTGLRNRPRLSVTTSDPRSRLARRRTVLPLTKSSTRPTW